MEWITEKKKNLLGLLSRDITTRTVVWSLGLLTIGKESVGYRTATTNGMMIPESSSSSAAAASSSSYLLTWGLYR